MNPQEINNFDHSASEWWNENGPFKPLHQMNPIRLSFIIKMIEKHFGEKKDLRILDVGCGGGLLCEPLSRLGFDVTGIDASQNGIKIATEHAEKQGLKIDYQCTTIEEFKVKKKFDIITGLEVLEHIENRQEFLKYCADLLKKDGLFFFSTLNRTIKSYLMAIVGAEYVLRLLPIGTHQWEKFIRPSELVSDLSISGLEALNFSGMCYKPISQVWALEKNLDVNYIGYAIKK